MDGGSYERDFFAWTQAQAAALRRLAETRSNLDAEIDLPHLIEEVEDLGREQLHRVDSSLRRLMQHLIYLAEAPGSRTARHWRAECVAFRYNAASRYLASMRQALEPRLDRSWRAARMAAAEKLDRDLHELPQTCPWTLDALLDEAGSLDRLLAVLHLPSDRE